MRFASSAVLKQEIEAKLASRIPAALSPRVQQAPRLLCSGIAVIDALLGGGLPIGGISEFTGAATSGRTSLALSVLGGVSAESACAYIDVHDNFDPRSAAAAAVRLENLLWVRFSAMRESIATPVTPATKLPESGAGESHKAVSQSCGWSHPRTETKGLDRALEAMLARKAETRLTKQEGTPGHPNRKLSLASASDEQLAYERCTARKPDELDPLRRQDRKAAQEARQRAHAPFLASSGFKKIEKPWSRLDKAIRATDQILQSGGFRVVVLDLASVAPEQALRVPSATWFRFRRAAEESDAVLLLLTRQPCARSSAAFVLDCSPGAASFTGGSVLSGISQSAAVARQRVGSPFGKKAPGRVAAWDAVPPWTRAAGS